MRKVKCDTWFQSQLAYIIGQMKGIKDPAGKSMLDSSVLVGMNSMRTGTHETTGVPVLMAGSCGGYFKTGRSLALPAGTPNNRSWFPCAMPWERRSRASAKRCTAAN